MQTASVQTQTDPEICNEALRDQQNEALALFRKGTNHIKKSKTDNPRIIEAKEMLYRAEDMCKEIDFFIDCLQQVPAPEPVMRAGAALPASARVVDAAGKPNAMAVADTTSRGIRGGPARADAGTKRAAAAPAKTKVVEIISSDDEAEPKRPCLSKPAAAAGGIAKAAKLAPEQVKPGQLPAFDFTRKYWHREVHNVLMQLRERKIYDVMKMSDEALDELRTLPVKAAMTCLLDVLGAPERIDDVNAFVVKKARSHRFRDSLPDAKTILKQMGMSDEDSDSSGQATDAGCMAKDNAAEKAPAGGVAKAPPEVVYAFKDGVWHNDVYNLQCELAGIGKFNFDMLIAEAEEQLRTLPYPHALLLLGKIRDEKQKIRNVNAFIVKNAIHLRNQFGLDDAKTIVKQIQKIDDSESGDD